MPVIERIGRAKYTEEKDVDAVFDEISAAIHAEVKDLIAREAEEE